MPNQTMPLGNGVEADEEPAFKIHHLNKTSTEHDGKAVSVPQPPIWAPPNLPLVCPWKSGSPDNANPHHRQPL